MGKGMPAALLMTTVRAALRSTAPYHDPAGTLQVVNRALWDDLDRTASFVTIFHAALYPERGEFHFVDAGQGLAACVSKDGTTHPLGCTGLPIGIEPDPQILGGIVHPAPGDAIVICSDGIVESIPDLAALLHGSGTHRSVHNILDAMFDPTRAAMPAADDRTALVIRRKVS
jgi:serine phosphatase RsbU (regulator of sigma subunit)